jgi:Carboxypeptidase regulatory-like domain
VVKVACVAAPCCILIGLFLYFVDEEKKDTNKVHIEGYVFDSDRRPIAGVEVAVYVTGKTDSVIGTKTVEKTGKYSLDAEITGPYDISFTQTKYRPRVVTQLCDRQDQRISITLYRKGEPVPATAAHTYLQSVDRLIFLAISLPKNKRKEFLNKFTDESEMVFGLEEKFSLSSLTAEDIRFALDQEREQVVKRVQAINR